MLTAKNDDDDMWNALTDEDGNFDEYENDYWYKPDGISARDHVT